MEFNEQGAVALTLNTTKVCDVSPTTYIVQTPPQSMNVCMNMNSLHILSTITVVEFPLYTKPSNECKDKKHKYLKTNQSIKPNAINPPKLLPHWQQLPKWAKSFIRPT